MATTASTVETEILDLERRYWQAMKERDARTAISLTDFPCLIAGASGAQSVDRASYEKMLSGASWRIEEVEIEDGAEVRQLSDDVAVIVYGVKERMTVDGKPVDLHAFDSSVWIRRGDGWKCAAHTESVAGDGYGRDRKDVKG